MTAKNTPKRRYLALAAMLVAVGILVAQIEPDRSLAELSRYQDETSRFVELDALRAHYRREGRSGAPVLLLLHGTGASLHTWDGWTEVLRDDYDIVRVDLPAFGLTGARADRDYSTAAYVEFVADFADALGLERFVLAGNSLGGRIAWHYALAHGEKLQALVLLNASGWPADGDAIPFVFRLARTPLLNRVLVHFAPRGVYAGSLREVYHDDSRITPALIDRYRDLSLFAGNRQAFVDRARQPLQAATDRLGEIATPTLILWGETDAWIPVADAAKFAATIPDSTVIVYPDLGHVPMEEQPRRTARDVDAFLQSLAQR